MDTETVLTRKERPREKDKTLKQLLEDLIARSNKVPGTVPLLQKKVMRIKQKHQQNSCNDGHLNSPDSKVSAVHGNSNPPFVRDLEHMLPINIGSHVA